MISKYKRLGSSTLSGRAGGSANGANGSGSPSEHVDSDDCLALIADKASFETAGTDILNDPSLSLTCSSSASMDEGGRLEQENTPILLAGGSKKHRHGRANNALRLVSTLRAGKLLPNARISRSTSHGISTELIGNGIHNESSSSAESRMAPTIPTAEEVGVTITDDEMTIDTMPFDERQAIDEKMEDNENVPKQNREDVATSNMHAWCNNIIVVDDVNDCTTFAANGAHAERDVISKMEQLMVEDQVMPFEPFVSKPWEEQKEKEEAVQEKEKEEPVEGTIVIESSILFGHHQSKRGKNDVRRGNSTPRNTLALLGSIFASNEELKMLGKGDSVLVRINQQQALSSDTKTGMSSTIMMTPTKPSKGNSKTLRPTPERSPTSKPPSKPTPAKPTPEMRVSSKAAGSAGSAGSGDSKWDACLSSKYAREFYLKRQKSAETQHLPPLVSRKVSSTPTETMSALSNKRLRVNQVKAHIGYGVDFETETMQKHEGSHCSDASVVSDITYDDDKISLASGSTNRLMMTRESRKTSKSRVEKNAATTIQSAVRRKLAWAEAKKRSEAPIVCIQAFFRGVATRRAYNTLSSNAVLIQTAWRTCSSRKHYLHAKLNKLRLESAVKIQARLRTHIATRNYSATRVRIVAIQSLVRTNAARKHTNNIRSAKTALQKYFAAVDAVTSIQARARMRLARKRYEATLRAIVTLQSWSRRMSAQCEYRATRRSVIVVQSLARRNESRKSYVSAIEAAVTLQTMSRRNAAQRSYQQQRCSAIVLQTTIRTALAVGAYKAERKALETLRSIAALIIQKVWRGHLARIRYAAAQKKARNAAALSSCWTRFALGEEFIALSDVDLVGTCTNNERSSDTEEIIAADSPDLFPEEYLKNKMDVNVNGDCSGEEIECVFNAIDAAAAETTVIYSVAPDGQIADGAIVSHCKSEDSARTDAPDGVVDNDIENGNDKEADAINDGLATAPSCEAYEVIFDEKRQKCVIASLKPKADDVSRNGAQSSETSTEKEKLYINRRSGKIVRKVKRSEKDKTVVAPASKGVSTSATSMHFPSLADMMTSIDDCYAGVIDSMTASCGTSRSSMSTEK